MQQVTQREASESTAVRQFPLATGLHGSQSRANLQNNRKNKFLVFGDHAVIIAPGPKKTTYQVTVDLCDIYRLIAGGFWRVAKFSKTSHIYAYRTLSRMDGGKGRILYMHRFITGAPAEMDVDHWDHDTLNNRRSNIRVVSHAENMRNRKVSPLVARLTVPGDKSEGHKSTAASTQVSSGGGGIQASTLTSTNPAPLESLSPVLPSSYAHVHPANNPAPVPKDAGAGTPQISPAAHTIQRPDTADMSGASLIVPRLNPAKREQTALLLPKAAGGSQGKSFRRQP